MSKTGDNVEGMRTVVQRCRRLNSNMSVWETVSCTHDPPKPGCKCLECLEAAAHTPRGEAEQECPITGDRVDNSEMWHCPDCERKYGPRTSDARACVWCNGVKTLTEKCPRCGGSGVEGSQTETACRFGGIGHDPTRAGDGCEGCDKLHADLMDKHVGPAAKAHTWKDTEAGHCDGCGLTRSFAGPWFEYKRGAAYFGIISPAPPCDPEWPRRATAPVGCTGAGCSYALRVADEMRAAIEDPEKDRPLRRWWRMLLGYEPDGAEEPR